MFRWFGRLCTRLWKRFVRWAYYKWCYSEEEIIKEYIARIYPAEMWKKHGNMNFTLRHVEAATGAMRLVAVVNYWPDPEPHYDIHVVNVEGARA